MVTTNIITPPEATEEITILKFLQSLKYEHHLVEGKQKSFVPYSDIIDEISRNRILLRDKGYIYSNGVIKKLS